MKFQYTAKTKDGELKDGILEASDKFSAAKQIRDDGNTPISVKEVGSINFIAKLSTSLNSSIKLRDKIMFTRNMSGMLEAGLPVYRALQILSRQAKSEGMKKTLDTLADTISKGGTLSGGMEKMPKIFSTLFVSMVRAGEESGSIADSLKEVGSNLKKTYDLNKKIKSALMYPSIIISAIVIIGVLMLIYVVPTLTKTFDKIGAKLPSTTRFVIWISDTVKNHTLLLFLVVAFIILGIVTIAKLKSTQKYFDSIILKLPVIGNIAKEVNTARTARTISSLLTAGVTMSRSLEITRDILQNVHYKKVVDDGIKRIEKGEALSTVFKENTKLYPMMMGEMMEVGEETGKVAQMMLDIASFYEAEVDAKTKDLSTIIEPVLMIIIGASVGFFAISMLTPMYSILDNIK